MIKANYNPDNRGKPIDNSFQVDERFYAGEYPGDRNKEKAFERLQLFVDCGITHFFDLTEDGELEPYYDLLPRNIHYSRYPIRDVSTPNSLEFTSKLIEDIRRVLSESETNAVYLHCRGGVGRTGTIVAGYFAWLGLSYEECLLRLRHVFADCPKSANRRSPETLAQVLYIKDFIDYLHELSRESSQNNQTT